MTVYAGSSVDYLSVADTARLVRKALRDAFPAVTFSVRSKSYSGGASIDVGWTDGPSSRDVDDVVSPFKAAHFDGSIDMKVGIRALVAPDGRVVGHDTDGTVGSRGYYPAVHNVVPGARLVHFGADYIFANRHYSPGVEARAMALLARFGWDDAYRAGWANFDRAVGSVLANADDDAALSAFAAY